MGLQLTSAAVSLFQAVLYCFHLWVVAIVWVFKDDRFSTSLVISLTNSQEISVCLDVFLIVRVEFGNIIFLINLSFLELFIDFFFASSLSIFFMANILKYPECLVNCWKRHLKQSYNLIHNLSLVRAKIQNCGFESIPSHWKIKIIIQINTWQGKKLLRIK